MTSLRHRLRHRLRAFGRDEDGATLTEFIIVLPVFIILFAGIVRLGTISQKPILVEAEAHNRVFEQAWDVQTTAIDDAPATPVAPHLSPASGSLDAMSQIRTNAPRQEGLVRQGILAAELATYSPLGMGQSGHWGESHSRVSLVQRFGVRPYGIDEAVTTQPRMVMGRVQLMRQLVYDGPDLGAMTGPPAMMQYSDSAVSKPISLLNRGITAYGLRTGLAAGARFGTVTGVEHDTAPLYGINFDFRSHYTLAVPPYVSGDAQDDAMQAVAVTRMAFIGPTHYTDMAVGEPAFDLQWANSAATAADYRALRPDDDDFKMTYPLDYPHTQSLP